jgi:hypothetical protein
MEKGIVAQAPRGAIPRALAAVALLRDAMTGQLDPDEALAAAERQLWLSWCSVCRVRADRAGEIPDRGRAA